MRRLGYEKSIANGSLSHFQKSFMYAPQPPHEFASLARARGTCAHGLRAFSDLIVLCIAFVILAVIESKSIPGSNETLKALRRTKTVLGELEAPTKSEN
jgi:hypothetical protein